MSVIKLPVSTFELTFVAIILGRSMTYDVVHRRFPSNGYHVAQPISISQLARLAEFCVPDGEKEGTIQLICPFLE